MRWSFPLLLLLGIASVGLGSGGCARGSDVRRATIRRDGPRARARRLLCPDLGDGVCLAACPATLPESEHVGCLLALRFGSDAEALKLARSLYFEKKMPFGIDMDTSVEGYRGEHVAMFPVLPLGEHRHHLLWLNSALERFDAFIERIVEHAVRPVTFEPRPRGIVFFTTGAPSYPSAFCDDGVIAYNVLGLLHADRDEMHETLFHELFHINDDQGGSRYWSTRALRGIYASIADRCAGDHACLEPYSPHPTVVPDGTFYAFDPRTGDVREYAAELALRYFREHETLLERGSLETEPFKCIRQTNAAAWREVIDEFFGGVDLTPACASDRPPEL